MSTERPISELVEMIEGGPESRDVKALLRDLQEELELLITRHRLEIQQNA